MHYRQGVKNWKSAHPELQIKCTGSNEFLASQISNFEALNSKLEIREAKVVDTELVKAEVVKTKKIPDEDELKQWRQNAVEELSDPKTGMKTLLKIVKTVLILLGDGCPKSVRFDSDTLMFEISLSDF